MKISQLFLCWTFPSCMLPHTFLSSNPLPSLRFLLSAKCVTANASAPTGFSALPPAESENSSEIWWKAVQRQYGNSCDRELRVAFFCTGHGQLTQRVGFSFLPLWRGGCRASWRLSAPVFQSFSYNFLGQIRTSARMSLPWKSVSVCYLSGWELFAVLVLSNPLTLHAEYASAGLQCIVIRD